MFSWGMKESLDDCIIISDVSSTQFEGFIKYLYLRDPKLSANTIGAMAYLAEKYMVNSLIEYCKKWLLSNLNDNNIIEILFDVTKYKQSVKLLFV